MEGIVNYLDTKEQVAVFSKLIPVAVNSAQEILKKGAGGPIGAPPEAKIT
jgi:hypothetical protein